MTTLAIFLPVAFVFGIAARRTVPRMAVLPSELNSPVTMPHDVAWERTNIFPRVSEVTVAQGRVEGGETVVMLLADKNFLKPDLLVYWVEGTVAPDVLTDKADLLGTFAPERVMKLRRKANTGFLILYSLADQQVDGISQPIIVGKAKP